MSRWRDLGHKIALFSCLYRVFDHGLHHAAIGKEADEISGERLPGAGFESWDTQIYCLCHPEFAGSLRVEDECGEFASQVERKALGDEDQLAAGGDHHRAFAGGVDLLLIGRGKRREDRDTGGGLAGAARSAPVSSLTPEYLRPSSSA